MLYINKDIQSLQVQQCLQMALLNNNYCVIIRHLKQQIFTIICEIILQFRQVSKINQFVSKFPISPNKIEFLKHSKAKKLKNVIIFYFVLFHKTFNKDHLIIFYFNKISFMVNILHKILEIGAVGIIIPIMLIPVIYHLADQEHQIIDSNPLYSTFDSEIFQSFEKKIDTAGHVVAYGKNLPEIMHFANQYAFHKMELEWKIIKWTLNDETNFKNILYFSEIREYLEAYMDLQTQKSTLWVIEFLVKSKELKKQAIDFIRSMVKRHPRSKFLITAQDKVDIKGFKQYKVPAINEKQFLQTLAQILGSSVEDAKIVINHYGSIANTIAIAQGEVLNLNHILGNYNRQLTNQSKKQLSLLKDLCKKGQAKSKKQMPGVDAMGTFFYNGKYYWRSFESVLNYKLKTNTKKCVFLDPGVPQILIPADNYNSKVQQKPEVIEEPQEVFPDEEEQQQTPQQAKQQQQQQQQVSKQPQPADLSQNIQQLTLEKQPNQKQQPSKHTENQEKNEKASNINEPVSEQNKNVQQQKITNSQPQSIENKTQL